jgi:hypothetical protein
MFEIRYMFGSGWYILKDGRMFEMEPWYFMSEWDAIDALRLHDAKAGEEQYRLFTR